MENEKWITDNRKRGSARESSSVSDVSDFSLFVKKNCPACGNRAERANAKFCFICGKSLAEDYQPLDAFRAAYRLQGKYFVTANAQAEEVTNLFKQNKNSASETVKALVVYSLVPFLGILFCPFALLLGGVGVLVSHRQPNLGSGRTSIYSLVLTVIIFAAQLFLWWLLYFVPELGRRI